MRGLFLAALAALVMAASVRWGSFVAGGSDSYCYVHQAERWAAVIRGAGGRPADGPASSTAAGLPLTGSLQIPEPLALDAPWPDAPLTFAPVGHVPSPTVAGAIAPICPPGLSLVMAPFMAVAGPRAAFAVFPLFGALLVAATYVAGSRFGSGIGMGAALLAASSPIFLYQLVQPMSDVPASALWLVAVAAATGTGRRDAAWSGLATSAAILVRPNLVPLGFAIGLFLLLRPERTWRQRTRAAAVYAAASAPGCVAVAAIQQAVYGSPLSSGYGSLDVLFAAGHVWPNVRNYASWLWDTHTPVLALAAIAPLLLPGRLTALFGGLFAINVALYLPYAVFQDWSYTRFLLPTLPLVLILVVAAIDAIWRRWTPFRDARPVVAAVAAVLAVLFVREAADRNAFRLRTLEARFERAGLFVRDRLPENALVITSSHSGSVRFYAGRKTLTWDSLDPAWLDRAVAFVRQRGYEPYLMFERGEEPLFRQRFRGVGLGALDWPPAAEIGAQVRIYRPDDRERYRLGTAAPTEYAR